MKLIPARVVAATGFVAVVVSVAIISSAGPRDLGTSTPRAARPTPTQIEAKIVLDPPYNYTEFAPPGPGDEAALTSEEALALFRAVATEFVVPSDATAQLGLYSGGYFDNHFAWGFSWHRCPTGHGRFSPAPDDPCTFWLFLDAKTGEMLVAQYQR